MPRVANDAVTVCNMALRHLGISKVIQALTEASQEAKACAAFFENTRDEVLGDYPWPFAMALATPALVAGSATAPATTEWQYSYRLPTDTIRVRRILSGALRDDTRETRIPFRTAQDASGALLYTDVETQAATATSNATPEIEYTREMDDPSMWPADFAQAVALKLAHYTAPSLTAGDQFKLGARAFALYRGMISSAAANDLNAAGRDIEPDSEFIRARA